MILTVTVIDQDIAAKIMSFSQQGPRAVCILSANGAVSTVTLRQSATSGGTVTYEVIVGSFIFAGSKARSKPKASNETGAESSELQVGDEQSAPYAAIPDQNLTLSSVVGGWPGSRQLDMRNAHIDIDLTRG
ncbi:hypothetical protein BHE74_00027085 [Ensete ventricosum]|nr:hypothetical protein BHE74_00027085 [Ensete ventricosum]RZS06027.1 hypothetical protein BHM03_00036608 [Ensete ventricosum]